MAISAINVDFLMFFSKDHFGNDRGFFKHFFKGPSQQLSWVFREFFRKNF